MQKETQSFTEEWAKVDGRRVRLLVVQPRKSDQTPPAPSLPIMLVHGLGCSAEAWQKTLREMAGRQVGCPLLATDLPGYGETPGPHDALGMEELADWLLRLMDVRQIERAHLVGNSMGCQVALAFARRHPTRTGALVLQGPTTGTHAIPLIRYIAGLGIDSLGESFTYNLLLMKMYTQMGVPRYLATTKKMIQDDPIAHAAEVTAPSLVIRGGKDMIIPDEVARLLTAALPDAVYMPLDHAAHAIEWTMPKEFTTAILNFLERAEQRPGFFPAQNENEPVA